MPDSLSVPLEISPTETRDRLADVDSHYVLLDCREPNEYETAAIPGSVLVPMSQWENFENVRSHFEGKHIVVHCHHGGRSLRVANWLRQNGFPNAQSMAGGIELWSQQIDPSIPRY